MNHPELVFAIRTVKEHGVGAVTCCQKEMYNHPPLGLISRVQIVVDEDGKYDYQVLIFTEEKGYI